MTLAKWRPLFWEPVEGTGERLMAGVVIQMGGELVARRVIRDDVLENAFTILFLRNQALFHRVCLQVSKRMFSIPTFAPTECLT